MGITSRQTDGIRRDKKIAVNLFEGFDESNMAGSWIEFLDITNILFQSVHSMIWMSTLHQLEYFCDMPL